MERDYNWCAEATLELAFKSKFLRTLCESEETAYRKLGVKVTKRLKARLEDLQAAANITELTAGAPRPVDDGTQQHMAVSLVEGYSIEFAANHVSNPVTSSGDVDWSKVRRIKILSIGKDNG